MATLRRHWVVAAACLVATFAVAGLVYLQVPVYYTAQTQLVVLSPATRVGSDGGSVAFNPYLTAGDGPSQVMASALQRVAVSPSFETTLAGRGLTTDYTVEVATSGGGVVLEVATVGRSPAVTLSDLKLVSDLLIDTLAKQQVDAGSPDNQLLTMRDLVGPSAPTPLPGDRVKLAGIAGVLGLVLTGLTFTALAAKSQKKAAVPLPPATTAPADLPPATSAAAVAPANGAPPNPARRADDPQNQGRRLTDRPVPRAEPLPRAEPVQRAGHRLTDAEETVALPKVAVDSSNGRPQVSAPKWPDPQPTADPGR